MHPMFKCLYEDEERQPDMHLFEELGWDRDLANPQEKHYRKFYTTELEKTPEIMSKPSDFECYDILRGQTRGAGKSIFSKFKKFFKDSKKDKDSGEDNTT